MQKKRSKRLVPAVDRAARILAVMAGETRPMSITALARHLNASKGTIRDILETLRDHGFLDRDEATKLYRLGPQLVRLGASSSDSQDLLTAARPHLVILSEAQREIVVLLVPQGDRLLIQLAVEPNSPRTPVLVSATPGRTFPATAGACGKVLQAWMDDVGRAPVLRAEGTRRRALQTEINTTRRNGYAVDNEEFMKGVRGVSAPVLGPGGRLVGMLLVSGFAGSMSLDRLHKVGVATRATAESVSRVIGGPGALVATGPGR